MSPKSRKQSDVMNYARTSATIGGRYRAFFASAVAATLLLQITIVTDTIIVGQLLGPVSMSGVRVASPIVNILNVLAMLVGVGGATLVSIAMGKRDPDSADRIFTLSITLSIAIGLVFAVVVTPLADVLANLISSDKTTVSYTAAFLRIVTAASPVYILASVMALLLRADSCIKLSSVVLSAAGVANVAFDLLFMGVLGMGVEGSALATDCGMFVAVALSLFYFRWPKRTLRLQNPLKSLLSPDNRSHISGIMKNGAPGALRLFLTCVSLLFLNYSVGIYVGYMGIAFFTVCGNIQLLAMAFFSAAGQAAIPIIGVLYGERDFGGVRLLMRYVFRIALVCVGALVLIIWIFPAQIINLFVPEGLDDCSWLLRLYVVGYLPLAINYVLMYYFNTMQRRSIAITLTTCENLVFYLPLIWLLTLSLGMVGTVLAFVGTEFFALALVILMASRIRRREGFDSLLLIPDILKEIVLEATLSASDATASGIAHRVKGALDSCGVDSLTSLRAAMGAEEMVANAARLEQNRDRNVLFDVLVSDFPTYVQVSMRDNGAAFDPLLSESDEEDDAISVMLAVVSNAQYHFTLGMNQTIIEVEKS